MSQASAKILADRKSSVWIGENPRPILFCGDRAEEPARMAG